jgi:hypothetical protein
VTDTTERTEHAEIEIVATRVLLASISLIVVALFGPLASRARTIETGGTAS